MTIYHEFQPTYLYIKEHRLTGMKYLGKTVKSNLYTYHGSGKYWKKHIKKHGKEHVQTIWFEKFYDKDSLMKAAERLSRENDIVNSPNWANLIEENGLDGTPVGVIFTEEHRKNMAQAQLGKKMSDEARAKMREANLGKKMSAEARAKMSLARLGKKRPPEVGEKIRAAKLGKPRPDLKGKPRPDVAARYALLRSQKAQTENNAS